MNFLALLGIALGLAMDSFAVSVTAGTSVSFKKMTFALLPAAVFGFFQGFMFILGWSGGTFFARFVSEFAPWVAFGMLGLIGLKMIEEGRSDKNDEEKLISLNNLPMLAVLGIATSIDALAVGISFALLSEPAIMPGIVIGIVTFALSFTGVFLGDKLGTAAGRHAEILGGVILIFIGLKIILENIL